MPFISNKERSKKLRKLTSGNSFRKWFLTSTILLSTVVMFLTFLSMFVTMGKNPIDQAWVKDFLIIDTNDAGSVYLTDFGIIIVIFYVILTVLNLICFIIVLTMKSNRETFKQTVKLTSTPLSGKKNKKNAAKTTKERIGIGA